MDKNKKESKTMLVTLFVVIPLLVVAVFLSPQIYDKIKASLFFEVDAASKETQIGFQPTKIAANDFTKGCDVVVVGGGAGGVSAAIQSSRLGVKTCLIEDTPWLGGMLTSAGASAIDGGNVDGLSNSIFGEFKEKVKAKYKDRSAMMGFCTVSGFCYEPKVGAKVLEEMVAAEKNLRVYLNTKVTKVYKTENTVTGVLVEEENGDEHTMPAFVTIDATEYGDVLGLAGADYDLGADHGTGEPLEREVEDCIQPLTYIMVLRDFGHDMTIEEPENYDKNNYKCSVKNPLCEDAEFTYSQLIAYGLLPNGKVMINWPQHLDGNDFFATAADYENVNRDEILQKAKDYSLGFLYFMQTELGENTMGLYNEFNTEDGFPYEPYMRESRRMVGVKRLTENDLTPSNATKRPPLIEDSVAVGDYPIDLHFCTWKTDLYKKTYAFQVPYGVIVPEKIDGLLAAEKNISVSHIANGATRLQPVVMAVGQAAGAAAATAFKEKTQPRNLDVSALQEVLLAEGSMLYYYKDLKATNYAFKEINKLSLKGVFRGDLAHKFFPNDKLKRAEIIDLMGKVKGDAIGDIVNLSVKLDAEKDFIASLDMPKIERAEEYATRAEALKLLLQGFGYSPLEVEQSGFRDVLGWRVGWVAKARELKVVDGSKRNIFEPDRQITKAEFAYMLSKLTDLQAQK